MDFRILGPLEVLDDGREISIRGRKLQSLLALLLLHAGEVVSRDRLIDDLWGDDPPSTAAKTLQVHVSRLRRELGDTIVSHGGGYLIRVEPGQLDLERFGRLTAEGRTALADGHPERASELLRDALDLWRGPPLPELAGEPFARSEIGRLEDARLDAIEARLEAELELGHHAEATQELELLVDRHPYRERLHELRMLALYRSGRQADALAAYQDARNVLVEELGLEPGKRLRELHAAILAQDPALEAPARPPPVSAPEETTRRRRWLLAAGVAALALAALLVALLSAGRDESGSQPISDDSHAVAVIDPATNSVSSAVSVGRNPGPLAFEPASRSVWVGNLDDRSVTRIDLRPLRTGRTIAIGQPPADLAAGNGAVWVVGAPRTKPYVTAHRIDARFDTARPPVRIATLPEHGASVSLSGDGLWVASSGGRLARLDPATGRIVDPQTDVGPGPTTVEAGRGSVWVGDDTAGVVSRVDVETGIAEPTPVAGPAAEIALGGGAAWVTLPLEDAVVRIDPETGSVRSTIPVGGGPAGIAVGEGAVWVANSGDGTVSRLDPKTGDVTETIPVGGSPQDVVVAAGRVWVSVRPRAEDAGADPGGTIRIEMQEEIDSLDPALGYLFSSFSILHTTCAMLVRYASEPGTPGTTVVPELAEAMPRVSDGGRTYTFTIRDGFRFSPPSGEPVTARSMKFSIERSVHPRMGSPARGYMSDLVGAKAYAQGRAREISGISASGKTLTLRLTHPSPILLHRLTLPFFCAVPLGTPVDPEGLPNVPSAGPYYVATNVPGEEVVLRRNPNYGGFRPRRPDQIRVAVGVGQKSALARVEAGTVDYTPIVSGSRAARRLQARYGTGDPRRRRYVVKPMLELDQLIFNTSRPPFSSARLRRAVNFALDRRAIARQGLFNEIPAQPTDQYLPPTMPGFRPARIYPLRPDVARARRLAGNERRSVVLYTAGFPSHARVAEIVKANLRAIGMDVEIRTLGDSHFTRIARRGEPFDLAVSAWAADFPDPLDFLRLLDGRIIQAEDNVNYAYFDDPAYNRRLDAASRLPSPARELALGRLEVDVARESAPWAALANNRNHFFFSARVGCQQYTAVFGLELGSLCIRGDE